VGLASEVDWHSGFGNWWRKVTEYESQQEGDWQMESDDLRAVQDHISSFTHYTVHFQFGNALMTVDRRLQTADQILRNSCGPYEEHCI
jgi:hypothetical protein